ncbi:hypothetical protein QYF36_003625 [Acer negundo]|nr:hypothetical protein QYF36_003625 [Acer negundo]
MAKRDKETEEFMKELDKIFSKIHEILKPNWRSSLNPKGSANKEQILTTKQKDVGEKGKKKKPTERSSVSESEDLPGDKNTEPPEVVEVEKVRWTNPFSEALEEQVTEEKPTAQ